MTKPSEAALKAARDIAPNLRHESAYTLECLAVRIDAAADEKYAALLTQVEMVLSPSDGKIKTLLRRLDMLRDALRKIKGEK